MTTSLITAKFRNTSAVQFLESFNSTGNTYYLFAAKSNQYPNSDDVNSLSLFDNESNNIQVYKDMIFGKKIANTDVAILAPRYDWTPNTVYNAYSDTSDLFNTKFYSVVNESNTYHVYKCLDNAGGIASTQQPTFSDTAANDVYYSTSDGYQWKYLSTISGASFVKFSTPSHFPLIIDANVSGNAVSGAIDTIKVNSGGTNYNNYLPISNFNSSDIKVGGIDTLYNINATASSVNGFYTTSTLIIIGGTGIGQYKQITNYQIIGSNKLVSIPTPFDITPDATSTYQISPTVQIVGDGQQTINAAARALVNAASSNSVYKIEILNRGANYFYASATVLNSPQINQFTPAVTTPIIGPNGGHGADLYSELNGRFVGIGATFANTEANTVPAKNQFREVGLLRNPLFSNVSLTIQSTSLTPGSNGTFVAGEAVLQDNTGAKGIVVGVAAGNLNITSVLGIIATGNTTFGLIRGVTSNAFAVVNAIAINGTVKNFNTFDRTFRYVGTSVSGSFSNNEIVLTTNVAFANALYHSTDVNGGNTTIRTTEQFGNFNLTETLVGANSGASMIISTKYIPDIIFNSGKILYVEGFNAVSRANNKTEQFTLVLDF